MIYYYSYLKYAMFAVVAMLIPVILLIILKIIQKFTAGRCRSLVCLNGKTAIVTGAGSGIGYETALLLASRGCRVILADRDVTSKAINKIIEKTNNTNLAAKHLDLTSFQSIREFAEDISQTEGRLDILVNNAGTASSINKHTDDGLNLLMQVNHFGPFLLTHLLADLLKKSAPSRIIFVSSALAFLWTNLSADNLNSPRDEHLGLLRSSFMYGNSKLCNVISANGFADRLKEAGVTSNSLHPGLVNTELRLKYPSVLGVQSFASLIANIVIFLYGKTPEEGAQTSLSLAVSNKWKGVTGKHFWDCRTFIQPPKAWNRKLCDDIWTKSEEYCQLKDDEKLSKL